MHSRLTVERRVIDTLASLLIVALIWFFGIGMDITLPSLFV